MKAEKLVEAKVNRRGFLKAAAGAAIGAGVAASQTVSAAPELVEDEQTAGNEPTQGYQLTQHILDYYKSAAS
ncbi:MAG: twin-arginine translocation signal domain-containing protein [Chromatiales bacterium]|jgi:hypothetical protein